MERIKHVLKIGKLTKSIDKDGKISYTMGATRLLNEEEKQEFIKEQEKMHERNIDLLRRNRSERSHRKRKADES